MWSKFHVKTVLQGMIRYARFEKKYRLHRSNHFHLASYSTARVVPGHTAAYTPSCRFEKSGTSTGT